MNATFTKHPSEDDGPRFRSRIQMLFSMCGDYWYMSLGQLRRDTRFSKCSDPRDRVYAVLNLLDRDDGSVGIKPDYTKTVGQIYQEAILRIMDHSNSIEMLTYGVMQEQLPEVVTPVDIPS